MRREGALPAIVLRGSPAQMGTQHGELLGGEISALAEERIAFLQRQTRASSGRIQEAASVLANEVESTLPRIADESAATARAARIPYWKLICAGAVSDVADLLTSGATTDALHECTLATFEFDDSRIGIVGTWDTHLGAATSALICHRFPDDGPSTVALTTPGWPMQQGVTEAGLAFAIANLVSDRTSNGVPYIAALPAIVSMENLASATERARSLKHASARYYLLTDGRATSGVEVAPGFGSSVDTSTAQVHTNHFISALSRHDSRSASDYRSGARFTMMESCLRRPLPAGQSVLEAVRDSPIIQTGADPDDDATGLVFVLDALNQSIEFLTPLNELSDPRGQPSVTQAVQIHLTPSHKK